MPFDRKKELDAMESEGIKPYGAEGEEDMPMDELEMPEMEGEGAEGPDFTAIEDLYNQNEEFKMKVDEAYAQFSEGAEMPEGEEGAEMPEGEEEEDMGEEDLFA